MHLKRVRVPNFRVLKDVDISFEEKFSPRVFPLGSQNGGGKSTLLQLVFVLLHCAFIPDRMFAVQNTLKSFSLENTNRKTLAIINIMHEGKEVELEFFSFSDSYINDITNSIKVDFTDDYKLQESSNSKLKFSMISTLEDTQKKISTLTDERVELENLISSLQSIRNIQDTGEQQFQFERLSSRLRKFMSRSSHQERMKNPGIIGIFQQEMTEQLDRLKDRYTELSAKSKDLKLKVDKIMRCLALQNMVYICNYSSISAKSDSQALVCRVKDLEAKESLPFLMSLSSKIFLAAPSTQVFIFIDKEINKMLFKEQDISSYGNDYYSRFKQTKLRIPGLFTYDFLNPDILISAFKSARDDDFREAIETGEYGTAYKALLNDLNSLLLNKQINLSSNLSEITFKSSKDNSNVEFYPEDLSHGELKRLSIYMWLRHRNIEDAIVLMDEIEIALHPDWQYGIVSDLMQWSPTNQYILATHSYELCQALTPAHVKELEPKLLRQTEQSV